MALSLAANAAAAQDADACKRAIAKETAKYETTRSKRLQKCEDGVLKGKVTPPCPDADTAAKINDAKTKMDDKITAACTGVSLASIDWDGLASRCTGGDNGTRCAAGSIYQNEPCTVDGDCDPNPDCTGSGTPFGCCTGVGTGSCATSTCTVEAAECSGSSDCPGGTCDPVDRCPKLENRDLPSGTCDMALVDQDDIVDCLQCMSDGVTTQMSDLYFGDFAPAGDDGDALKCQRTLGKAAAKFFQKKRKILQKCTDGVIKGTVTGPCPDADSASKISAAETKMLDKIGKACGGDDKSLGTSDDLSLAATGGTVFCPGLDIPGAGADCHGTIGNMQDLAECLRCVTEFKADCADRASFPTAGALQAECNPTCGNGVIEAGETCDDGNFVSGDACPSDCSISSCTPGVAATATVSFTAPAGVDIAGVTVLLEYPDSKVRIPGSGCALSVVNSIGMTPGSTVFTPNDLDYAVRVVLYEPSSAAIAPGTLFQVTFDTCQGGGALAAADMTCRVENASDTSTATVGGVNCTVAVP
jgi:cysteine-rich repeat protein